MLFRFPCSSVNVLIHFGFYKIAEKIRTDSVILSLAFHHATGIDWYLSGGSDDFCRTNLLRALRAAILIKDSRLRNVIRLMKVL